MTTTPTTKTERIDALQCVKRLAEQDDILLLCHRDPDGDAVGSASALALALSALGKRVKIDVPEKKPKNLVFLRRDYPDFEPRFIAAIDVAAEDMLGEDAQKKYAGKIDLCIDHHPTNPCYARETFLVNYAAAGEGVYEVLKAMNVPITPDVATALFTALSSDTGGFRFANTTAQTHRYAADLMEAGADTETVRRQLFDSKSRGRIRVESDAMANARFYHDGKIVVISVTDAAMRENGVEEYELDGLPSEPLHIEGVVIAVTLKQREDGMIRVSMRSDSDEANVAAVCARFGGGGHVRASGCRLTDTLEHAEELLVAACEEELSR